MALGLQQCQLLYLTTTDLPPGTIPPHGTVLEDLRSSLAHAVKGGGKGGGDTVISFLMQKLRSPSCLIRSRAHTCLNLIITPAPLPLASPIKEDPQSIATSPIESGRGVGGRGSGGSGVLKFKAGEGRQVPGGRTIEAEVAKEGQEEGGKKRRKR